jgi:hypothetical protein
LAIGAPAPNTITYQLFESPPNRICHIKVTPVTDIKRKFDQRIGSPPQIGVEAHALYSEPAVPNNGKRDNLPDFEHPNLHRF